MTFSLTAAKDVKHCGPLDFYIIHGTELSIACLGLINMEGGSPGLARKPVFTPHQIMLLTRFHNLTDVRVSPSKRMFEKKIL